MRVFFYLLLFSTLVFSCAKKDGKSSVETSYIKAKKQLDDRDYGAAAEAFEKIDDDFPFSKWGTKGRIMALYARYKNQENDKALQLIDDFVVTNPSSEYVAYALYMKGLIYYNQIPSVDRAQDDTKKSSSAFRELIARFPDDFHSSDAVEKLNFVDEHIAGAKMVLGRNHIENKNYVGAIENFYEVVRDYRNSEQAPEAYFRIVESYYKIGLKQEGFDAAAEMKNKFPNNSWTKSAIKITEDFGK